MTENKKEVMLPWLLAWLMVDAMVGVAVTTGEKEIIFPEIAALVLGGWVAGRQPWEVNRTKQVLLMTIGSLMGIGFVRFVPFPKLACILLAFSVASVLLIAFKCTFLPVLSACILPILLGVSSLVYPVAVITMTLVVAMVQKRLEAHELREIKGHVPCSFNYRWEAVRFALLFATLAAVGALALGRGWTFLTAPPLIVGMAELSDPESPSGSRWPRVFGMVVVCAAIGAWGRLRLTGALGAPEIVSAAVVMAGVLVAAWGLKTPFPPAGAIALLPFLLEPDALLWYPLQVTVGFALMGGAALGVRALGNRCGRDHKKKPE